MNEYKRRMVEILKRMRDDYGCLAVKAEFEAEGSRTDEMVMLLEVLNTVNVPLIIKIGGCEAVRDLDQCKFLGASAIMAPMIETPYALKKFKGAASKVYGDRIGEVDWIINAETITCHENYDAILTEGNGFLDMVGIGRVDYSSSKGLTRADINNEEMLEACTDLAIQSKKAGLTVAFGGGISFDAIPFIQSMAKCADRYETRKVNFAITDDEKTLKGAILNAMRFEVLYLHDKCAYYDAMANEDRARLEMMSKRIEKAESLI